MYALQEQTAMSGTAGTDRDSICDQTPENICMVDRPDAPFRGTCHESRCRLDTGLLRYTKARLVHCEWFCRSRVVSYAYLQAERYLPMPLGCPRHVMRHRQ
jgi:hypothetical protein